MTQGDDRWLKVQQETQYRVEGRHGDKPIVSSTGASTSSLKPLEKRYSMDYRFRGFPFADVIRDILTNGPLTSRQDFSSGLPTLDEEYPSGEKGLSGQT